MLNGTRRARVFYAKTLRSVKSLELWSGVTLLIWGGWIGLHPRMLYDIDVYDLLTAYLNPAFWFRSTMAFGALQAVALCLNLFWVRNICIFVSATIYTLIAYSNYHSGVQGPAMLLAVGFALGNLACLRSRKE